MTPDILRNPLHTSEMKERRGRHPDSAGLVVVVDSSDLASVDIDLSAVAGLAAEDDRRDRRRRVDRMPSTVRSPS